MERREERPAWYTVKEAAALLRMSPGHIVNSIKRGDIPGRMVGKSFRVEASFCHPEDASLATWPAPRQTTPAERPSRRVCPCCGSVIQDRPRD